MNYVYVYSAATINHPRPPVTLFFPTDPQKSGHFRPRIARSSRLFRYFDTQPMQRVINKWHIFIKKCVQNNIHEL